MHDAIVVGSGPGGANAAAALVERGRSVLMLDVGEREMAYDIPPTAFADIRRTHAAQRRFMLGEAFEGIPEQGVKAGAQLTPPRRYVTADVASLLPTRSGSFTAVESLALGGLGAAWGAGVFTFDESELAEWPAEARNALAEHYDAVAARIGISADDDDLAPFFPSTRHRMPVPIADPAAALLLARYTTMRAATAS
jgi:choline dehydrogenase-like flavoprotein